MQEQERLFRKAALEKLSSPEELDQLMQVTTPQGWLALLGLMVFLVCVVVTGVFGVIPVRASSDYCIMVKNPTDGTTQAYVYLQPSEDRIIRPGNPVQIRPSTIGKADSAFIIGETVSVGEFPVSAAEMERVLGNETLVNQLLRDQSLILVLVDLQRAEITDQNPTGFQWSDERSHTLQIQSKLLCEASIEIERKRPIELILRDLDIQ
jgi:hypothetical protein